ncbi:replication initiation protein [Clostridium botulinum]|uniref:replication initiation protein n=1 Tax=Clostridium botulinum TaxID=1491 RepID=UPI00248F70B0|nr:replication initiation protein [Clostridium botulinum]BDB03813.1 hypothetical protein CBOS2020_38870 [Clostridium botulinum]
MDKLDKNYYIIQHNSLIQKKKYLNLNEQKVMLIFASLIRMEDEEFKTYEIPANEIMDLLEVKNQSKYATLRDTIYSLASKPIKIESEKGFKVQPWFSYAEYENGIMRVEFNKRLKNELLQLKEYFTKYRLKNVLKMKSKYSIQVYELLRCNLYKKTFILTVEELRSFFNLEKKYKKYNDLKKYTLQKALEEINNGTDISFEFEELKEGRKVTSIKFHIKSKVENKARNEIAVSIEDKASDYINEVKSILEEEITNLQAKQIYDVAKGDIDLIKEKYNIAKENNNIKSIVAFMVSALKEDYKGAISKVKVDRFNDFEQRSYDFEKLESQLLGWEK